MIGSVTGAGAAGASAASQTLGQLDGDAFLKLLVAQLRYQDPSSPADSTAMLQQSAQFTQVETLQQLAGVQQQLAGLQQATIAADLVGKEVSAVNADGAPVAGVVDSVRFGEQGPVLQIGGIDVPLTAVVEVRRPTVPTA